MHKRKLIALDYSSPDNFNVNDEQQFRHAILWLEDQKIRHYKIEDRAGLRAVGSPSWIKSFETYLADLSCPHAFLDRNILVDWLLGYAIRLEYGDNVDKYSSKSDSMSNGEPALDTKTASNPLDSLDFDDPAFKAGVTSLAHLLQVPPHSSHTEVLKAICLLVKERMSKENIEKYKKDSGNKETVLLETLDLGFDAGDYILNEVAKILRLLHIKDLRELQNSINQAIVAVQAITANPKTDTRLGRVGR